MDFFPPADGKKNGTLYFEKSATYFDSVSQYSNFPSFALSSQDYSVQDLAPLRAHRLLPNAHLIALVISPGERAYSWYQHMRAHKDPTAMDYSFYEVITAKADAPKALKQLQSRYLI